MADKKKIRKKTEEKNPNGSSPPNRKEKEIVKIEEKIESNIEKAEEKEEKNEKPNAKQLYTENKILANVLIILAVLAAAFIAILILSKNSMSFSVDGATYTIVKNGQLTFYDIKIPVVYQGKSDYYNFYLHNDPRSLKRDIQFNGTFYAAPYVTVNVSNSLNCQGEGGVSMVELSDLYGILGANISANTNNQTCNSQPDTIFINIQPSNETSVLQDSPACYSIKVADCQILPAVERYMMGAFSILQSSNSSG